MAVSISYIKSASGSITFVEHLGDPMIDQDGCAVKLSTPIRLRFLPHSPIGRSFSPGS
jgi:hypothetical protein